MQHHEQKDHDNPKPLEIIQYKKLRKITWFKTFIHTQHLPIAKHPHFFTFHFNSFSSMLNTCLSSKHK